MKFVATGILGLLGLLVYLLLSYVLMKIVKFQSRVKYLFGLSIIPILAILIIANLWLLREFIPGAWWHFERFRSGGDEYITEIVIIVSVIPTFVGAWLYYTLFRYLDRKYSKDT